MKKISISLLIVLLVMTVFASSCLAKYPEKDISGIIMWGAGGETDKMARMITPLAEKYLGKTIVLQNKSGASGALSMQFVRSAPADGYTILYGAQDPLMHKVLDIANFDYLDEFYPVMLLSQLTPVVNVPANSPYKTMEDLIEAAKNNPGDIKAGITGTGALPFFVNTMMKKVHGIEFNEINFDGSGPGLTALMGEHIDVFVTSNTASAELYRGGKVRTLSVIKKERISPFDDVPAITEIYPEYNDFLPWGPFLGVWARKNIPAEAKTTLSYVFEKAYKEDKFQEHLRKNGLSGLGMYGDEADKFISRFQSVSCWLLEDANVTKFSPEKFGIERP